MCLVSQKIQYITKKVKYKNKYELKKKYKKKRNIRNKIKYVKSNIK